MALETKGNTQIAGVNSAPANTPKQEKTALVKFAESEAIARMRAPQRDRTIATSRTRSADHFTVDPDTIYQRQAKSNNIYLDPLNQHQWGAQLSDSQSGWEKLGNSVAGFGVGAAAGFLEGIGSWDMHELGKIFSGLEDEDGYANGNIFFKWSKALQEYNEESNPIFYDKDDMLAGGYWANKFKEMGVTAGIIGESWAEYAALAALTGASGGTAAPVTGAVGAAKAARTASLLARAGKAILTTGKAIPKFIAKPATWGVFQGLKTVYMNAHETQESTYNDLVSKGMSHEEALKHANEAATIGARTEFLPTIALNTLSWGLMGRIGKATKSPFNLSGMNKFSYGMSDVLENGIQRAFGIDDIANTALRRAAGIGAQMVTEGLEEGWEAGVSNYAKWQKMSELGYDTRDMSDAIFDENFRESLVAGAFGGAFFYGMGKGVKKAMDFYNRDAIARENKEKMETLSAIKESFNRANKTVKDLGDNVTEEEKVSIRRRMGQRNVLEALKFDYRHQTTDAFDGYIASIDHGIKLAKEGNTEALAELGMEGLTVEELSLMREQAMQAKQSISEHYFSTDDDFGIALEQVQREMGIQNLTEARERLQKELDADKAKHGYEGLTQDEKEAYQLARKLELTKREYVDGHVKAIMEDEAVKEALRSQMELENSRREATGEPPMSAQEQAEFEKQFIISELERRKTNFTTDEKVALQEIEDSLGRIYDAKAASKPKIDELVKSGIAEKEELLAGFTEKIDKLSKEFEQFKDKKHQRAYREKLIQEAQEKLNKRVEEIRNNPDLSEDEKIDEIRRIQGKRERLRTKIKRWFGAKKKNDSPAEVIREKQQRAKDLQTPTTVQGAIRQVRTPANPNGIKIDDVIANQGLVPRDRKTSEHYYIWDNEVGDYIPYERVHSVLAPMYVGKEDDVSAEEIIKEIEATSGDQADIDKVLYDHGLYSLRYRYNDGRVNSNYSDDADGISAWKSELADKITRKKSHYITMGNTIDSIVRDYFTGGAKGYEAYKEGISDETIYNSIIKQVQELEAWANKNGYTIRTESVVLWHTFIDDEGNTKRVAGEVDILITDSSGNILGIADVKTNGYGLHHEKFTNSDPKNGKVRSSLDFYTGQLSTYADLLEGQYGVVVDKLHLAVFKISGSLGVITEAERMDISDNIEYSREDLPPVTRTNPILDDLIDEADLATYTFNDILNFNDGEQARYLQLKHGLEDADQDKLIKLVQNLRATYGDHIFAYIFIRQEDNGDYVVSLKGYTTEAEDGDGNIEEVTNIFSILDEDIDDAISDPWEIIVNNSGNLDELDRSVVQKVKDYMAADAQSYNTMDETQALERAEDAKIDAAHIDKLEKIKKAALDIFNSRLGGSAFPSVADEHKYKIARLIANYSGITEGAWGWDSFTIRPVALGSGEIVLNIELKEKDGYVFIQGGNPKTITGAHVAYDEQTREYRLVLEILHANGNKGTYTPTLSSFISGKNSIIRNTQSNSAKKVTKTGNAAVTALSTSGESGTMNYMAALAVAQAKASASTSQSTQQPASNAPDSKKSASSSTKKTTTSAKKGKAGSTKKKNNKSDTSPVTKNNSKKKNSEPKGPALSMKDFVQIPGGNSFIDLNYTSENFIEASREALNEGDTEILGLTHSVGSFIDSIVEAYEAAYPNSTPTLKEAFLYLKATNSKLFNQFSIPTKFTQMMIFYNTYLTRENRTDEVLSGDEMDDLFQELFDPNAVITMTGGAVSRALDAFLGLPSTEVSSPPAQDMTAGYVPAGASFRTRSTRISHTKTIKTVRPASDVDATLALSWGNRHLHAVVIDPQDHYSEDFNTILQEYFGKDTLATGTTLQVHIYDPANHKSAPDPVKRYMEKFMKDGHDLSGKGEEIKKWDELDDTQKVEFWPIYYTDSKGRFVGYMPAAYEGVNYTEVMSTREAIKKYYLEDKKTEPITTSIVQKRAGRYFTKKGAEGLNDFSKLDTIAQLQADYPGANITLGHFVYDNGSLKFVTVNNNEYTDVGSALNLSLVFDTEDNNRPYLNGSPGVLVVTPSGETKVLELQTAKISEEDATTIAFLINQAYHRASNPKINDSAQLNHLDLNLHSFVHIPIVQSEPVADGKLVKYDGDYYFNGEQIRGVVEDDAKRRALIDHLMTLRYYFDRYRYYKNVREVPKLNDDGRSVMVINTGIPYREAVHARLGTNVRLQGVSVSGNTMLTPYIHPTLVVGELKGIDINPETKAKVIQAEKDKKKASDIALNRRKGSAKGQITKEENKVGKNNDAIRKAADEYRKKIDKATSIQQIEDIKNEFSLKVKDILKGTSTTNVPTTTAKASTQAAIDGGIRQKQEEDTTFPEDTEVEVLDISVGAPIVKVKSTAVAEEIESVIAEEVKKAPFRPSKEEEANKIYKELRQQLYTFYSSVGVSLTRGEFANQGNAISAGWSEEYYEPGTSIPMELFSYLAHFGFNYINANAVAFNDDTSLEYNKMLRERLRIAVGSILSDYDSMVDNITAYNKAIDKENEGKDESEKLPHFPTGHVEAIEKIKKSLEDITKDDTFNLLMEDVLRQLAAISKTTFVFEDNEDGTVDISDENTEADVFNNYSENEIITKHTLSQAVKRALSGAEEMILDANGQEVERTGALGLEVYVDFNYSYDVVENCLTYPTPTISNFEEMMTALGNMQHRYPFLSQVIERLRNSDLQTKNAFVYAMRKNYASPIKAVSVKQKNQDEGTSEEKISIIHANSREGNNAVVTSWRREAATILGNEEGIITVGTKEDLRKRWEELVELVNNADADEKGKILDDDVFTSIEEFFSSIGINIPLETIIHINEFTLPSSIYSTNPRGVTLKSMFTNDRNQIKTSPLFGIVSAILESPQGVSVDEVMRQAVSTKGIQGSLIFTIAETTGGNYSKTYRDGGKVLSSMVLPRYANDAINRLKDPRYLGTLAADVYAASSMWYAVLKDSNLAKWFTFNTFSSEAFSARPDARFTELSTADKERIEDALYRDTATSSVELNNLLNPLAGFGDTRVYEGIEFVFRKAMFPTMSDKTQMYTVNAPSIDTGSVRSDVETSINNTKAVIDARSAVKTALKNWEKEANRDNPRDNELEKLKAAYEAAVDTLNKEVQIAYQGNIKALNTAGSLTTILTRYAVLPEMRRVIKSFTPGNNGFNVLGHSKAFSLFLNFPEMNALTVTVGNREMPLLDFLKFYADPALGVDVAGILEQSLANNTQVAEGTKGLTPELVDALNNLIDSIKNTMISSLLPNGMGLTTYGSLEVLERKANEVLATSNMFSLIIGDPAYYVRDSDLKKLAPYYKDGVYSVYNAVETPKPSDIDTFKRLLASSVIESGGTNMGKRLSLLTAQGFNLANSENDQYVQVFMEDLDKSTTNLMFMIRVHLNDEEKFKKNKKKYQKMVDAIAYSGKDEKKIDAREKAIKALEEQFPQIAPFLSNAATDAQEYTTTKEHVDILFRQGRLSEEDYKIITEKVDRQILKSGKGEELNPEEDLLTRDELQKVMQPLKPVYTGTVWDEPSKSLRPMYVKSSSFPLIPQVTLGTELDKVRVFLERVQNATGKNVRASYSSANKVGSPANPIRLWNTDGTFNEELNNSFNSDGTLKEEFLTGSTYLMDRSNFKIQLDVPYKDKDYISIGTQLQKLLFGDGVMELEGFKYKGREWKGAELQEEYNNLMRTIIDIKKKKLFLKFGLDSTGRMVDSRKTYEEVRNLLLREGKKKGWTASAIALLQKQVDDTWDGTATNFFSMPLFMMPNSQEIATLLHSFINKEIFSITMPGYSFVGGSEAGFKFKSEEELQGSLKSNIIYTSSWTGSLKAAEFETDDNGNVTGLKSAQVLMPSKIRDNKGNLIEFIDPKTGAINEKYVRRDENTGTLYLIEEMFDMEIFKQVAFRIPTSSLISSSSIEVVGILPPEAGDLIIVPSNFTTQKGMDFDIDKENIYSLYTYVDKEGHIKAFSKSKKDYDAALKGREEEVENSNVDIYTEGLFVETSEEEINRSYSSLRDQYSDFAKFYNALARRADYIEVSSVGDRAEDAPYMSPFALGFTPKNGIVELEDGTKFLVPKNLLNQTDTPKGGKEGQITIEILYQAAKFSTWDKKRKLWVLPEEFKFNTAKGKAPQSGSILYVDNHEELSNSELEKESYDRLYKKLYSTFLNQLYEDPSSNTDLYEKVQALYENVMGKDGNAGTYRLNDRTGNKTLVNHARAISEYFFDKYKRDNNIVSDEGGPTKATGIFHNQNSFITYEEGNYGLTKVSRPRKSSTPITEEIKTNLYGKYNINYSANSKKRGRPNLRAENEFWEDIQSIEEDILNNSDAVYIVGNATQLTTSPTGISINGDIKATAAARIAAVNKKPLYVFVPSDNIGEYNGYWWAYDYNTNQFVRVSDYASVTPPLAKRFYAISAATDLQGSMAMDALMGGRGATEEDKSKIGITFTSDKLTLRHETPLKIDYLEQLEKSIKNDFVRLTMSVVGHSGFDIQKIMASALSMDVAKEQVDLLGDSGGGFKTFTTRDYHLYKSELGAVGRMGIGVYSNAVVTNSLLQQARARGVNTSLTPGLIHKWTTQNGETRSKAIDVHASLKLGDFTFNTEKHYLGDRKKTFDGARTIAEVLAERQNTATDNEKEQIMGKLNVNEFTIGVDTMLSLMGFDLFEYTIPETGETKKFSIAYAILTSKYVKKFVEEMKERGISSFDDHEVLYSLKDDEGNIIFPAPKPKWGKQGESMQAAYARVEIDLNMNDLLLGAKGKQVNASDVERFEEASRAAFRAFIIAGAMSRKTVQQNKYVNVQKNKLGIEFEDSWKRTAELTPDARSTKDGYILEFSRKHTLANDFYSAAMPMYSIFEQMYFGEDMQNFLFSKAHDSKFTMRLDEVRDAISTELAVYNLYKNHGINYNMLLKGGKKTFSLSKTLAIIKGSSNVPAHIRNNGFMQKVYADDKSVKVNYDGSDPSLGLYLQHELTKLYHDDATILVPNFNNTGRPLTPKLLVTLMAYRSFIGMSSRYGNFRSFIPAPLVQEIFEGLEEELAKRHDPSWSNMLFSNIAAVKSNRKLTGNFRIFSTEYAGMAQFVENALLAEDRDTSLFDDFLLEATKRHDALRIAEQDEDPDGNTQGPVKISVLDEDAQPEQGQRVYGNYSYENNLITLYANSRNGQLSIGTTPAHGLNVIRHEVLHAITMDFLAEQYEMKANGTISEYNEHVQALMAIRNKLKASLERITAPRGKTVTITVWDEKFRNVIHDKAVELANLEISEKERKGTKAKEKVYTDRIKEHETKLIAKLKTILMYNAQDDFIQNIAELIVSPFWDKSIKDILNALPASSDYKDSVGKKKSILDKIYDFILELLDSLGIVKDSLHHEIFSHSMRIANSTLHMYSDGGGVYKYISDTEMQQLAANSEGLWSHNFRDIIIDVMVANNTISGGKIRLEGGDADSALVANALADVFGISDYGVTFVDGNTIEDEDTITINVGTLNHIPLTTEEKKQAASYIAMAKNPDKKGQSVEVTKKHYALLDSVINVKDIDIKC